MINVPGHLVVCDDQSSFAVDDVNLVVVTSSVDVIICDVLKINSDVLKPICDVYKPISAVLQNDDRVFADDLLLLNGLANVSEEKNRQKKEDRAHSLLRKEDMTFCTFE